VEAFVVLFIVGEGEEAASITGMYRIVAESTNGEI
jgi:hypothetical protein